MPTIEEKGNGGIRMKYRIKLTEEQYDHIEQCVEVCHRIACGQIEAINEILPNIINYNDLLDLKKIAFPELSRYESYGWNGGYRGTGHDEDFCKAFDKFQAQGYQIWHHMLYIRNVAKNIDNVYSFPTLPTNKAEQPIIEVIK